MLLTVPALAQQTDWQSLFDGASLTCWVQRGGSATYRVEAGQIVGASVRGTPNSFLCTEREFADFELEFECRIDPRLNSGVQFRSASAPGYQAGRVHGYQVDIDPTPRAWTGGIYDEARRGWLADLSGNDAARAAFRTDDWNLVRVSAIGDRIRTWVNGVPAVDLTDGLTRRGFVALQVHGTEHEEPLEVRWRNIRARDLGDPWAAPPVGATVLIGSDGDLSLWEHAGRPGSSIGWKWSDGFLEVVPGTGDIVTRRPFGDCRLHVEFCVDDNGLAGQANGNSGVYLQSRYEVQILNSAGQKPANNICGALYGLKAADYNLARPAGEWQTYDIFFTAPRWVGDTKAKNARMTVYHNGTRIHGDVELTQQTGAGAPETPGPGPLRLQDHGNKIRFRNIWIVESAGQDD